MKKLCHNLIQSLQEFFLHSGLKPDPDLTLPLIKPFEEIRIATQLFVSILQSPKKKSEKLNSS